MQKFWLIIAIVLGITFGGIYYYFTYVPLPNNKTHSADAQVQPLLKNWQTEANLPVIGSNLDYNIIFLGTSHGRIFSRFHNHSRVEKILNKSIINLSQGAEKGGSLNQQIFLEYFYQKGNTADTLVYFVDPFIFFHRGLDENPYMFVNEPLQTDFYRMLEDKPLKRDILMRYRLNDTTHKELEGFLMYQKDRQNTQLSAVEPEVLKKRVEYLYQDEYDDISFKNTIDILLKTIDMATEQGTKVIVIVPTTLLPDQPHDPLIRSILQENVHTHAYTYYDYSHAITDPSLYYDVDHLNTEGVIEFTYKYLKPILTN